VIPRQLTKARGFLLLRPSVWRTLQRSRSPKRGSPESAGTRRDGVLQEVPLAHMQQTKMRERKVYLQAATMVVASQQGKVKHLRYSVSRSTMRLKSPKRSMSNVPGQSYRALHDSCSGQKIATYCHEQLQRAVAYEARAEAACGWLLASGRGRFRATAARRRMASSLSRWHRHCVRPRPGFEQGESHVTELDHSGRLGTDAGRAAPADLSLQARR